MGTVVNLGLHSSRGVVRMAERKWMTICEPEHQQETRQYSSSDHAVRLYPALQPSGSTWLILYLIMLRSLGQSML